MKVTFYILFFLITNSIVGQIVYTPVFVNQCSKKVEEDYYWYLTDSTKVYQLNKFNREGVSLPRAGKYKLFYELGEEPIIVTISNERIIRDTIFLKRLVWKAYISYPPVSEWFDCDGLANGMVTDYYDEENKRMQGEFKDGQPIDSLFYYFRSGGLSEIFIDKRKGWKSINYFENGQIESIYDDRKKYEKIYYPNGQIKKEESWTKKYRSKCREYYQEGIKMIKDHKERKKYNKNGVLIEKIQRKEIFVFDRLFDVTAFRDNYRYYKYTWNSYDANGIIQRKIIFNNSGSLDGPFLDDLDEIESESFEEIIFFKNGIEVKKVEVKYEGFVKKLYLYSKE